MRGGRVVAIMASIVLVVPAVSGIPGGLVQERSSDMAPDPCNGKTPHPPIQIAGDAMFKLGPAVGVVNPTANGTAQDPYVIEGWCLLPAGHLLSSIPEISIRSTEAHLVIRNNTLPGPFGSTPSAGILINDARNVTLQSNRIERHDDYGVSIGGSEDVQLQTNVLRNNEGAGIRVDSSSATIHNNTVTDTRLGSGILLFPSSEPVISGNHIARNEGAGIRLIDSNQARVENNTIVENSAAGVGVDSSEQVKVANNTLERNGRGVKVQGAAGSDGLNIRDNVVAQNSVGIEVGRTEAEVNENNLKNNGDGIQAIFRGELLDAERNWWGCSDGPEDPNCDDVEGKVDYDPWLTEPNPEAGPE